MRFDQKNFILSTDAYKATQYPLYMPGTTELYSHFESRGGRYAETIFFGLQLFLQALQDSVITSDGIDEADLFLAQVFGANYFNRIGWERILKVHGGRLPISIKALPEGTLAPVRTVLFTVENTDPELAWLTNYVETYISQVWYPITVASLSWHIKQIMKQALAETGCNEDGLDFALNDFGMRGASSYETAEIGGMAHLLIFKGTDNLPAIAKKMEVYGGAVCGHSVAATEHSNMTSWGGREGEEKAFQNALNKYPKGILSVVSDSYDIYKACKDLVCGSLKDQILARDGKFVVRPDSGRPEEVVVKVLNILGEGYGVSTNQKHFKILHPKVGVLQGDGVNIDSIELILQEMKRAGWAASNIVFGSGGALLQKMDRDTHKFAFKASAIKVNGEWRDAYKEPITDQGKNSKRGRFSVVLENGKLVTVPILPEERADEDQLKEVFRDGEILKEYTWGEIQKNLEDSTRDYSPGEAPGLHHHI